MDKHVRSCERSCVHARSLARRRTMYVCARALALRVCVCVGGGWRGARACVRASRKRQSGIVYLREYVVCLCSVHYPRI